MPVAPSSSRGLSDTEQFTTGLMLPYRGSTNVTAIASRLYFARYLAVASMTVTKIAVVTSSAATNNDNCDAGIYNGAGTSLLGSAGSTAGKMNAAAGVQQLTLTAGVTIAAGTVYIVAFAYGTVGGTAASIVCTSMQGNQAAIMGALPNALQGFQNTAFPLAAPITNGGAISSVPVMALLA